MISQHCRHWVMCALLLVACGAILSAEEPAKLPTVPVARTVVREVTDFEDFTGQTDATGVNIVARTTGFLTKMLFKEGDTVKEGDVLFEIDSRPYQIQVDQAQAQSKLQKAKLQVARATLNRDQDIAKKTPAAISQLQLDHDQGEVDAATASVQVAEATVELAKLNLSYCKVTAPMSGQIGRSYYAPGNLVMQDKTKLAAIVSLEPLAVMFDVDEVTYVKIMRSKREDNTRKFPVAVGLAGEKGFPRQGVLDFIDNRVDLTAGTIRMRGTLPNKDGLLIPGMFVRVQLTVSAPHKSLLIPDHAIGSDVGLKYVYVLDADNKLQHRLVTTGALQPDGMRVISGGLTEKDRVAVGRLAELRQGMKIEPQEIQTPAPKDGQPPEKAPTPPGRETPSARGQPGPGILVDATYPGASAQVVSDTVRFPIEEQISGMEKLRSLRSRCTSDGRYVLNVAFSSGVDNDRAQILVQNRATLALPVMPTAVQNEGISVRKGTSGILLIANLYSPNGIYNQDSLSSYAQIAIRDELARLPGIGAVSVIGASEQVVQVHLDTERLAALGLSAPDVLRILKDDKDNRKGEKQDLANLLVNQNIRLRDVARVEPSTARRGSEALLDGKPSVALVLYILQGNSPAETRAGLRYTLDEIRKRLPDGLELDLSFDFAGNLEARKLSAPEYLLLDMDMVGSAAAVASALKEGDRVLRRTPGVAHVLGFTENPFDQFGGRPSLLVQLGSSERRKASHEEVVRAIRNELGKVEGVTFRLRDLSVPGSFPRCAYPFDLAFTGPDAEQVRKWASELGKRLRKNEKLADVWVNTDSQPRTTWNVEIDRKLAMARGVAIPDILNAIELYTNGISIPSANTLNRALRLDVPSEGQSDDWTRDLGKLKIRTSKGQMTTLAPLIKVREVETPAALDFLNLWPMVEVTANTGPGTSIEEGKKLCTTLAEEVRKELGLSKEYRLTWLVPSRMW